MENMQQNLRSLQNKGIDLRCTIEEKIRQLNPSPTAATLPTGYQPTTAAKQTQWVGDSSKVQNNNFPSATTGVSRVPSAPQAEQTRFVGLGSDTAHPPKAHKVNITSSSSGSNKILPTVVSNILGTVGSGIGIVSGSSSKGGGEKEGQIAHQIGHILKVGKHRLLSTTGFLCETVDDEYSERVRAATQSKSLLFQIENEFKAVVSAVSSLAEHYDTLLGLLEKFRAACDDQLAKDADADAAEAAREKMKKKDRQRDLTAARAGEESACEDFVVIGDGDGDGCGGDDIENTKNATCNNSNNAEEGSGHQHHQGLPSITATTAKAVRYRITRVDAELASLRKTLTKASEHLKEGVTMSCHPISITTRTELDATQTNIISDVTSKKTSFDLTKHKALSRGLIIVEGKNGNLNSTYADHSCSYADSSSVFSWLDGVVSLPAVATAADHHLRDELISQKQAYDKAVSEGKRQLHFALEQASMSTWSCYNVFFQQMANYFGEALKGNSDLAKVLVALKNQQSVAVQLTEERKARQKTRENELLATLRRKSETSTGGGGGGDNADGGRRTEGTDLEGGSRSSGNEKREEGERGDIVGHLNQDLDMLFGSHSPAPAQQHQIPFSSAASKTTTSAALLFDDLLNDGENNNNNNNNNNMPTTVRGKRNTTTSSCTVNSHGSVTEEEPFSSSGKKRSNSSAAAEDEFGDFLSGNTKSLLSQGGEQGAPPSTTRSGGSSSRHCVSNFSSGLPQGQDGGGGGSAQQRIALRGNAAKVDWDTMFD